MAARLRFKTVTFSGAKENLSTLLGQRLFTGSVAIRAAKANVGTIYWGDTDLSGVTNCGGYLDKGESFSLNLSQKMFSSDQIYFIAASASDKAHITFSE